MRYPSNFSHEPALLASKLTGRPQTLGRKGLDPTGEKSQINRKMEQPLNAWTLSIKNS